MSDAETLLGQFRERRAAALDQMDYDDVIASAAKLAELQSVIIAIDYLDRPPTSPPTMTTTLVRQRS